MKKYGLIGYPLEHSFSKEFFNSRFRLAADLADHYYENFPLSDLKQLPELLMSEADLLGFNVTIPYKTAVIPFLDTLSPEALTIGAVNTVSVTRDPRGKPVSLSGYNTDVIGFEKSLRAHLGEHRSGALILGTGGSSKAVKYVLNKLKIPNITVSRTPATGRITYEELSPELMRQNLLIVNTTPLGMFPHVKEAAPLPYRYLTPSHLLFDLVYNPQTTVFLQMGIDAGAATVNGIDMLHFQAEAAWEIWSKAEKTYE